MAEDGELGRDGKQAEVNTSLGTAESRKNKNFAEGMPRMAVPHTGEVCVQDRMAPDGAGHEIFLYQTTEKMEPFAVEEKNVLPLFYYLPEENEKVATYAVTIDTNVNESIARFVTGDLDLNKDWDEYLKNLDSYGLQDYLETIQTAYDRWVANAQ